MLLHALLSVASYAQTYTIDLPIVRPAPTHTELRDTFVAIMSYDVAQGYADQVIPSDWSYIRCELEDGIVNVIFEAPVDAWPSSFPSAATCAAGSYTLVANLVSPPMNNDYNLNFTPSMGLTIASAPNVGFGRTYKLPVGPAYQEGKWTARLNPTTPWTGVTCAMVEGGNGAPYLQIAALPTAAANSGYCILQSASGVPHAIALTITR